MRGGRQRCGEAHEVEGEGAAAGGGRAGLSLLPRLFCRGLARWDLRRRDYGTRSLFSRVAQRSPVSLSPLQMHCWSGVRVMPKS